MKDYNILWTGGWDSTYRLLDLVLVKKKEVQPYYILDSGRASTKMELATMDKIKNLIYDLDKAAKGRIKDTIYIKTGEIPENILITKMYTDILKHSYIGSQYDWLARFADSVGINNLELCIHQDDKAHTVIQHDVEEVITSDDHYFKLKKELSKPELQLFSYFHYPILTITKIDMEKIAKSKGFIHIMEETWFCHNPYKGKPCGMCNPCKYTKEEGLGRRVPSAPLLLRSKQFLSKLKTKILK